MLPCLWPGDQGFDMSTKICFANQGELIKLAYDAFGVLPRKEVTDADFDEKAKKAVQKKLGRLAEEKGHLSSNFSQCSGLMKPDTHLGENARQIEVSDDQTTPFLFC
jgi:hypothetical protein